MYFFFWRDVYKDLILVDITICFGFHVRLPFRIWNDMIICDIFLNEKDFIEEKIAESKKKWTADLESIDRTKVIEINWHNDQFVCKFCVAFKVKIIILCERIEWNLEQSTASFDR